MSNKAAFIESEKGHFVVHETEIAQPGEGEVLIKVRPAASDKCRAPRREQDLTYQTGASMCHPTCRCKDSQAIHDAF
jgi:Zn-dependent alcohol dehydrogenase